MWKMKIHGNVALLVLTITVSGLSFAYCPITMPQQLLQDCIVNENAGASFPPSDYAYMDLYQEWMKTQQPEKPEQPKALAKSNIK
jgi:hypothetical protein